MTPGRSRAAPRRTVAVADLHGELAAFKRLLTEAGLLDGESWCGSNSILVQLGDVIDRGPHSAATYSFLADLQARARKGRGRVVRLLGNHEVMLLEGDYSLADFGDAGRISHQLKEDVLLGRVQAAYSHGGWLFTHAGLQIRLLMSLRSEIRRQGDQRFTPKRLAKLINSRVVKAVQDSDFGDPLFAVGEARGGERDVHGGIFWADFDAVLETPARAPRLHQVLGHTPEGYSGAKFRRTSDGRRINIDIGISDEYGGNLGFLEIIRRSATAYYLVGNGLETETLGEAPPVQVTADTVAS